MLINSNPNDTPDDQEIKNKFRNNQLTLPELHKVYTTKYHGGTSIDLLRKYVKREFNYDFGKAAQSTRQDNSKKIHELIKVNLLALRDRRPDLFQHHQVQNKPGFREEDIAKAYQEMFGHMHPNKTVLQQDISKALLELGWREKRDRKPRTPKVRPTP